jgi:S1-C subfamily serine protease
MNHLHNSGKLMALWSIVMLVMLLISSGCGDEEDDAAVMTPRMIADVNKPGVVMITNIYKAKISVPSCKVSAEQSRRLMVQLSARKRQGELRSQQDILNAYVSAIAQHPDQYLIPSSAQIQQDVEAGCMGSGFIVTQDGYIVTNAHVVCASEDNLKEILAQEGLQQIIKNNIQDFQRTLSGQGYSVSTELLDSLQQAVIDFYAHHLQVTDVRQQVYASYAMGNRKEGIPCEIKKHGEPAPGKDIAILKAEKDGMPTVQLGDDSSLKAGDKMFVLGFPGAATFNQFLAQDGKLESSFTSGMLSARKAMENNWDVLQIDAAITHGNSGGPVLDETGHVVGVVTFGSLDEQGSMVQGMNFAIPVGIVRDFLKELGVKPEQGKLTKQYYTAVTAFNQADYDAAYEQFCELQKQSPDFPYIKEFLDETKKKLNDNQ